MPYLQEGEREAGAWERGSTAGVIQRGPEVQFSREFFGGKNSQSHQIHQVSSFAVFSQSQLLNEVSQLHASLTSHRQSHAATSPSRLFRLRRRLSLSTPPSASHGSEISTFFRLPPGICSFRKRGAAETAAAGSVLPPALPHSSLVFDHRRRRLRHCFPPSLLRRSGVCLCFGRQNQN